MCVEFRDGILLGGGGGGGGGGGESLKQDFSKNGKTVISVENRNFLELG